MIYHIFFNPEIIERAIFGTIPEIQDGKEPSNASEMLITANSESIHTKETSKYRQPHMRSNRNEKSNATISVDASQSSQPTKVPEGIHMTRDSHTFQESPRYVPHDVAECPIYKCFYENNVAPKTDVHMPNNKERKTWTKELLRPSEATVTHQFQSEVHSEFSLIIPTANREIVPSLILRCLEESPQNASGERYIVSWPAEEVLSQVKEEERWIHSQTPEEKELARKKQKCNPNVHPPRGDN